MLQYPLELRFRLMTFAQRIAVTDRGAQTLMFIKQKMFKLREKVDIYDNDSQSNLLFRIEADRVIDFSANYHFTDADGNDWGALRRKGMKSLWAAHYDVIQDGQVDMTIREESPIKKVLDSLLGEIPLVGMIAVYFINPTYLVCRTDGTPLLRLVKEPAFWEGRFTLQKLADMPEDDELRSLMSLIMVVLLERRRG